MRSALAVLISLIATAATAQTPPCIPLDPGWTQYYTQGQIQYVAYNLTTRNMVFTFRTSPPTNRIFQNIPQSIAQKIYPLTNADAFFAANIATQYPEGLLTPYQSNLCPLLNEKQAFLWTHPNPAPPPTVYYLGTDAGLQLYTDAGVALTKG